MFTRVRMPTPHVRRAISPVFLLGMWKILIEKALIQKTMLSILMFPVFEPKWFLPNASQHVLNADIWSYNLDQLKKNNFKISPKKIASSWVIVEEVLLFMLKPVGIWVCTIAALIFFFWYRGMFFAWKENNQVFCLSRIFLMKRKKFYFSTLSAFLASRIQRNLE